MANKKILLTSLILNCLIFTLTIIGTTVMFLTKSGALFVKGMANFKFFTVESNVFMGIVAIIVAIYQYLLLKGKIDKLPFILEVINLVGVSAVALTFFTVMAFLGPTYGYDKMFHNANLFFHLIVPLVALVNFLFFEKIEHIKFVHTLYCLIPPFSYGVVYFIYVAANNGYGNFDIDFYGFGRGGPLFGLMSLCLTLVASYIITIGIYFLNKLIRSRY